MLSPLCVSISPPQIGITNLDFTDKVAKKVITRVFYRGSFVKEYFFVYVDGYRMILPVPKAPNVLTITQFQYNLGRILNCQKKRRCFFQHFIFFSARFTISEDLS